MYKQINYAENITCTGNWSLKCNPIDLLNDDHLSAKLDFSKIPNIPDNANSNPIPAFAIGVNGSTPNAWNNNTIYFNVYAGGLVLWVMGNTGGKVVKELDISNVTIAADANGLFINNEPILMGSAVITNFINAISTKEFAICNGQDYRGNQLYIEYFGYKTWEEPVAKEEKRYLDYEGLSHLIEKQKEFFIQSNSLIGDDDIDSLF